MKAPLPLIKDRGEKTFLVMNQIVNVYQAPAFPSPNNFHDQANAVGTQELFVLNKSVLTSAAAGDLDLTLGPWHDDSVLTLKVGRVVFSDAKTAPTWNRVTANGGGRDRIISEGNELVLAWEASNPAWMPKPAKTLALFKGLQTAADLKFKAWKLAETIEEQERGLLWTMADDVWDLSVAWYEMATAAFGPETPQGILIRTIPTSYDPNKAPGQLHFTEHFSPAPSQVKLVWAATRGQHFNIYAKAPGALEWTKILNNVTQTSWMGQSLQPGDWLFRGEAVNADGLGEMSLPITVPISAAQAA